MAVDAETLELWWRGLDDAQRTRMLAAKMSLPMSAEVQVIVYAVPGLPRVSGSFGGVPFADRIPEPVRSFVWSKQNGDS